jgi:hypothetical protein
VRKSPRLQAFKFPYPDGAEVPTDAPGLLRTGLRTAPSPSLPECTLRIDDEVLQRIQGLPHLGLYGGMGSGIGGRATTPASDSRARTLLPGNRSNVIGALIEAGLVRMV